MYSPPWGQSCWASFLRSFLSFDDQTAAFNKQIKFWALIRLIYWFWSPNIAKMYDELTEKPKPTFYCFYLFNSNS